MDVERVLGPARHGSQLIWRVWSSMKAESGICSTFSPRYGSAMTRRRSAASKQIMFIVNFGPAESPASGTTDRDAADGSVGSYHDPGLTMCVSGSRTS